MHGAHVQCVGWGCMHVQQRLHVQQCIHVQWCTHRKARVCAVCAHTPVRANTLCTYPRACMQHVHCACMHLHAHTPVRVRPMPVCAHCACMLGAACVQSCRQAQEVPAQCTRLRHNITHGVCMSLVNACSGVCVCMHGDTCAWRCVHMCTGLTYICVCMYPLHMCTLTLMHPPKCMQHMYAQCTGAPSCAYAPVQVCPPPDVGVRACTGVCAYRILMGCY